MHNNQYFAWDDFIARCIPYLHIIIIRLCFSRLIIMMLLSPSGVRTQYINENRKWHWTLRHYIIPRIHILYILYLYKQQTVHIIIYCHLTMYIVNVYIRCIHIENRDFWETLTIVIYAKYMYNVYIILWW